MSSTLLEDEILDQLSEQLQEEIDWEILCEILKLGGWREIQLPASWSSMTAEYQHAVKEWCRANLKGHYKARGRKWLFEKEKDASMFILRWI